MVHLTLVGLSADRTRLMLVDDAGQQYSVDVDGALRSALRGVDLRPGQLEIQMDSALRPRDIQARIRAGETPEAVAQAAQAPLERIMPYAAPVLAERAHMAERAQRSSVRRRSTEGGAGGARTLGEAVRTHLRSQGVSPDSVEWDAFRREDGRWTLTAVYEAEGRSRTAAFAFDVPGNYVTVEDEAARWLIGEAAARPARPTQEAQGAPRGAAPARRLSAVDSEQLPLGEDALELVSDDDATAAADGRHHEPASDEPATDETGGERPTEQTLELTPASQEVSEEPSREPGESPAGDDGEAQSPPAETKRRGRKGRRASVPSWDEIMFGGGRGE